MSGRLLWVAVALLMILPGVAGAAGVGGAAGAAEVAVPLSLAEVLALADRESPSMRLADLELEAARLAHQGMLADQILKPSVIAREQGESAWQAAQAKWELARRDLELQVEQTYYDVLRAGRALDLARRALEQSQTYLASTRSRHAQGLLSDVDLLAAESQAATSEAELNRAQAGQANARMQLNRLLGRRLDAPFAPVDEFAYAPVAVSLEEALAQALTGRLELQQARDNLALREKELAVSDPAFTPAGRLAEVRLAVARAKLELVEAETGILLEVRQNHQAVLEAQARIPLQEKNLTRAKESLRITAVRYDAGLVNAVDLIDAQRAAFGAETQVIQAVFDYNLALARFAKSAGYPFSERP